MKSVFLVPGTLAHWIMNFVKTRVVKKDDGRFHLTGEGLELLVPEDKNSSIESHNEKEIVFGIRPEDIEDKKFSREERLIYSVSGIVEVSEPMGSEVLLHVKFGDATFSARVDPHTGARIGETVELVFNMNKMHAFDVETENNLIYGE